VCGLSCGRRLISLERSGRFILPSRCALGVRRLRHGCAKSARRPVAAPLTAQVYGCTRHRPRGGGSRHLQQHEQPQNRVPARPPHTKALSRMWWRRWQAGRQAHDARRRRRTEASRLSQPPRTHIALLSPSERRHSQRPCRLSTDEWHHQRTRRRTTLYAHTPVASFMLSTSATAYTSGGWTACQMTAVAGAGSGWGALHGTSVERTLDRWKYTPVK
jgi:hypothetical protein